ncbi:hypothetical protein [Aeoliella sp.]|uniref:hypothetical protein n=1 Tax=Aeoliella sp. TaxID=2795800 RepID=UPI003CCB7D58
MIAITLVASSQDFVFSLGTVECGLKSGPIKDHGESNIVQLTAKGFMSAAGWLK